MALNLTEEQRAALRSQAIAVRTLVDLHLDSGRYSFWDGDAHVWFDDAQYMAAGAFASASAISLGQDLGAEGVELTLDGTRMLELAGEAGDPAAILGTIEAETYQMRRADIRFAFFDAASGEFLFLVGAYAGLIDQIRQVEQVGEDGRSVQMLVVSLESIARRYGRRGGRTRSNDDQQEIWPGDTFFKFTADAVQRKGSIWWGRKPPGAVSPGGGGVISDGGPGGRQTRWD